MDNTACVNKSASLKEHFFLEKLYVSFEKVYNNMIGNIISFYKIFFCVIWMFGLEIMANLVKSLQISLVWFTNITAFTTAVSVLKTNNSEQHKNFLTIIHVLIQFYMSAFDIR